MGVLIGADKQLEGGLFALGHLDGVEVLLPLRAAQQGGLVVLEGVVLANVTEGVFHLEHTDSFFLMFDGK